MFASRVAYLCVLLPLLTVHTTLIIAVFIGNLDPCIPYWSECHSISSTGRQIPEFFVFKALMIPTAVAMMLYWGLLRIWLIRIGVKETGNLIIGLGMIAGVALIVYTVTLGAAGEPYALARRIGVVLFFAFSAFAHLLLLKKLSKEVLTKNHLIGNYKKLFRACMGLLILGIASAIFGFMWEGYNRWDNALEWWFSLLLMGQFYLVGQMWDKTGFRVVFVTH